MNLQIQYFKSINAMKALQIECSFTIPCAYYEFCGVKLDKKAWIEFYHNNLKEFEKAKKALDDFVVALNNPKFVEINLQGDLFLGWDTTPHCRINWNSTDDVVPLLKFLGFNTKGYNKEKKEDTESKELKLIKKQKKVNPEFVSLFAEYSRLQKLCSTYGMQYINAINPKTGRIHTEFRALGTDTGRLACGSQKTNEDLARLKHLPLKTQDPKLKCCYPQVQNLPNTDEVRACFIAEEGNNFLSIDYNSEESRLLASLSGDKGMLEVFEKGYDMHSYVAYLIYPEQIPRDFDIRKIKKEFHDLRQAAKGPEFTFAFLGNWATLVANYGMPKEEAMAIEDNYKKGFAGATKYQEMCKKRTESTGIIYICKETGHIAKWWDWEDWHKRQVSKEFWDNYRTLKVSKEPIPSIYEEHFAARNKWDKNSVNSTTQGLGAVIFKHFNYELYKWVIQKGYFNKVKFCVPVHDEICLECPEELTDEVVKATKHFMESIGGLYCHRLSLPAQEEVGKYWRH
jgi:DNA polymerase-1